MAAMPLALNGRDKTLSQSEYLGRRPRGGGPFARIVVLSLAVYGALRLILEKFWLGQFSSVDNYSLFLKSSASSSTFDKRILVVLPMMGLKKTGLIEDDVVTEKRLAIQSRQKTEKHRKVLDFGILLLKVEVQPLDLKNRPVRKNTPQESAREKEHEGERFDPS